MTKRKDPADLKRRAQYEMAPVARKKRGASAEPRFKGEVIEKLVATGMRGSDLTTIQSHNPDRPLTEKQLTFVRFWAQGESILTAAYKSGYADNGTMAYRLVKDPAILKIYNLEKALYEEACQMTRKQVMEMLKDGFDTAKLIGEPASMVSAAREIGKMCGYYEPVKRQIDINVTGGVIVKQLERMSDENLLKFIQGEVTDVAFDEVVEEEAEHGSDS